MERKERARTLRANPEACALVRRHACSLCGCRAPRADCPRCAARQLSFFHPVPGVPVDAETVSIDELAAAAKRARSLEDARLDHFRALARPVRVGLVGCAKTKREGPRACRDLYKSPLFVASLAHAETSCDETYVLSAAHGLLALDAIVAPYDRSLRELPKKERLAWGSRAADSLRARFPGLPLRVLVLAGLEYADPFIRGAHRYGWTIETPLARKSIGQRLAWFKEASAAARPVPAKRRRGAP
jgi:hypothetical protein